ncbi:MAG TPA: phosphoribosyltransferase [Methylobacter sp.]
MKLPFENRIQAGRLLGQALAKYAKRPDVIILALPRGGVPVGFEIARIIDAPLDIMLVRKLGTPGQEELAMGAIASGGVCVLNPDIIAAIDVSQEAIEAAAITEQQELERRERDYRGNQPPPAVENHYVILVDDGLATGASMLAAVAALKQRKPASIVVAVPVAPAETVLRLQEEADDVVCLAMPEPFWAVGRWYREFSQTSDDEVKSLLARAWATLPSPLNEKRYD